MQVVGDHYNALVRAYKKKTAPEGSQPPG